MPLTFSGSRGGRPLRTVAVIAVWTEQPLEAVRSWVRRGRLKAVACDVRTRAQLYDMNDVPPTMFATPDGDA